jgi:hypothetical protein
MTMPRFLPTTGARLEVRRDSLEVTTNLPQPNPNWTYTDEHSHEHAYGTKTDPYPTLVTRHGEPYWCEDCQEEHWDEWLACPQCGERIEPGTFVAPTRKWISGPVEYLVDGEPVTRKEGERLLAEHRVAHEEATKAARASRLAPFEAAMRDEGLADDLVRRLLERMGD